MPQSEKASLPPTQPHGEGLPQRPEEGLQSHPTHTQPPPAELPGRWSQGRVEWEAWGCSKALSQGFPARGRGDIGSGVGAGQLAPCTGLGSGEPCRLWGPW